MEINQYGLYSTILSNTIKEEETFKQTLGFIQEFDKIASIDIAKKYLEAMWDIKPPVERYPICSNCLLSIKEDKKGFRINFTYNDENITYYYKK